MPSDSTLGMTILKSTCAAADTFPVAVPVPVPPRTWDSAAAHNGSSRLVAVIKPRRPNQHFKIRILRVRNAHGDEGYAGPQRRYRPGCRRLNTRSVTQVTLRVHLAVARAAGGRSVADFPCRAGEPGLRAEGCRAARRGGEIKPALLARIAAGGLFLPSDLVHREAPHRLTRQLIERGIAILLQMRVEFLAHSPGPEFGDVIGDAGDGVLALWLRAKKIADVIRHLHQVPCAATAFAVRRGAG